MCRSRIVGFVLLVTAATAGCTHLLPIRTNQSRLFCEADNEGVLIRKPDAKPEADCRYTAHETAKEYDLLFVEFDDQGMLYPPAASAEREEIRALERAATTGEPSTPVRAQVTLPRADRSDDQIRSLIEKLRELNSPSPPYKYQGLNIVVYVHGWNHNADADDEDVQNFRKALKSAELGEEARARNIGGAPRRVVGIYIGWRGTSLITPFQRATFWDRMTAARHVATGQARDLLARLKGFRAEQNGVIPVRADPAGGSPNPNEPLAKDACIDLEARKTRALPAVRLVLIGHSFGALLLYSATSQALTEGLIRQQESGNAAYGDRIGDVVVLLNPAFEATRYAPLHHLAQESRYAYNRIAAPIVVSVTSESDRATGIAFPIGRYIGTLFESTSTERESFDHKNTMGHPGVPPLEKYSYVTHTLVGTDMKQGPDSCTTRGWKQINLAEPREGQITQMAINLEIENAVREEFIGTWMDIRTNLLKSGWKRTFCGGATLTFTGDAGANVSPNTVVWNLRATDAISRSHNDIRGPELSDFLRQLYADTEICDFNRR